MSLPEWKQRISGLTQKLDQYVPKLTHTPAFVKKWKEHHSNELIGLDVGSTCIKLLKIQVSDHQFRVENFAVAPLPPGAVVKDEIKDCNTVANLLKDMFKSSDIKTKAIALAIPRSSVIIKNITVEQQLSLREIESRAWIEANLHFPDLVGDIYLDFDVIGPSTQDPALVDVMLVACRKDQIKPYLETLKLASLNAKIVDVNCYALERALSVVAQQSPKLETIALLSLDFTLSTLIVVSADKLIYAHDQSFDGAHLMERTQNYLKDKNIQINSQLVIDSLKEDTQYNTILKENLSSHILHTMHFFYSSRPNINIQKLVLVGDCAVIPNLTLFIRQEIGMETIVADPLSGMELNRSIDEKKLKEYAPTLMLCCGLALSTLKEV